MRAYIKPDLLHIIEKYFGEVEGHRKNPEFIELCKRIAGKEVNLVFMLGDAFEEIDNNYWLPECCWVRVTTVQPSKESDK